MQDWTPPPAFPFGRFEGTPHDVGVAHGRAFGDQILRTICIQRGKISRTGLAWEKALEWAENARAVMQSHEPRLVEEIDGIAVGAEVDRREAFAINLAVTLARLLSPAPSTEMRECTTAAAFGAATADGHTLLAQNWDQASEQQANMVVIEQRTAGERALLFVTCAGRLFLHGMNDAGVGIVGNAIACDRQTQPERSPRTGDAPGTRRRALRLDSAEAACRSIIETPAGTSNNHLIADAGGVAMDLEVVPNDAFRVDSTGGLIAHANHFVHPTAMMTLVDVNRKRFPDSLVREDRLRTGLESRLGQITVADVKAALADHHGHPVSVCSHPHPNPSGEISFTLASTIMDLNDRRMFVAPGPACLGTYTEYRFS